MKIKIKYVMLPAVFFALTVHAEVQLKDNSEIVGKWTLNAEALKLDGEKKALKSEWEFKTDGVLTNTATDSVGRTSEFQASLKYFVEDGVIKKQTTPGREKYETCTVIEKSASEMTLKCGNLYYFLSKK